MPRAIESVRRIIAWVEKNASVVAGVVGSA
jgi:hypothetical protein